MPHSTKPSAAYVSIKLNGETRQVQAQDLYSLLETLGYAQNSVVTARNQTFVPLSQRANTHLQAGDCLDILVPVCGG